MEINVNLNDKADQIIGRYRQVLTSYGPYFGQKLFTVTKTNPDLKWKEDTFNGKNTLRNEVNVYVLKGIDIKSVSFKEKDIDGNPKIIFNAEDNDNSLVFPLEKPDFKNATRDTISECIDRLSKPNSKPMFFDAKELPELVELLRIANQAVLEFYEEQSRKFLNLSQTVRGIMDQADRFQGEYLRQCGVASTDTEINIKVETNE